MLVQGFLVVLRTALVTVIRTVNTNGPKPSRKFLSVGFRPHSQLAPLMIMPCMAVLCRACGFDLNHHFDFSCRKFDVQCKFIPLM